MEKPITTQDILDYTINGVIVADTRGSVVLINAKRHSFSGWTTHRRSEGM